MVEGRVVVFRRGGFSRSRIEARGEQQKSRGRKVRLTLVGEWSGLPLGLVVRVQLANCRLDLIAELLGLVVGDVRRCLLDHDRAVLQHRSDPPTRKRVERRGGGSFAWFAQLLDEI